MKSLQNRMWMNLGIVAAVLVVAIPAGKMTLAQQQPGTVPPASVGRTPQTAPALPGDTMPAPTDDATARMEQQRERLLIDDRQKHLEADTARLVQLSTELQTEVTKSGKFVTSVTAMRKAEEIEKLAHSVRDRMRN